jgi:signal transduction histidine kinase
MLGTQIGVIVENSRRYLHMQTRARLAALGQMAAGLAHEVKNPLGAIKGAAQLLSEPGNGRAPDKTSLEFINIILEEVDRLDRVVCSVLSYGRPQKGEPGLIDVNAVIERTLRLLSSERQIDAEYVTQLGKDLPHVQGDAEQLHQVLLNLIRNACQATQGPGSVRIESRARLSEKATPRVEIAISDDGPGIPPEVRANLFVPFFTTRHEGTGLGLAISERIVQEMGGRIDVFSQAGQGSTFTVRLPAAASEHGSVARVAISTDEGLAQAARATAVRGMA